MPVFDGDPVGYSDEQNPDREGLFEEEPSTFDYGADYGILEDPIYITADAGHITAEEAEPAFEDPKKKAGGMPDYWPALIGLFFILKVVG